MKLLMLLVIVAKLAGQHFNEDITIENCINTAYNVIAKRKGEMKNGTFVKEK